MGFETFSPDPGKTPIDAARQPVVTVTDAGEAMADSRDVAAFFGKRHTEVLRALRELHCSDDFRRRNFASFKTKDLTGESTSHVTMTKDGFAFLGMGFTGAAAAVFKEAYIARFNVMEGVLRDRQTPTVPQSLPEALRLAADLAEKNEAQARAIAVLEPRSEALAVIADAEGSCSVTVAAKTLQMPPGELWTYLARAQWVYRRDRDSQWAAFQSKIQAGYLTHKAVPIPVEGGRGRPWVKHQVMVTAKGLTALAQRIPLDTAKPATLADLKSGTVPVLPGLKSDTVSDLPASQGGR